MTGAIAGTRETRDLEEKKYSIFVPRSFPPAAAARDQKIPTWRRVPEIDADFPCWKRYAGGATTFKLC